MPGHKRISRPKAGMRLKQLILFPGSADKVVYKEFSTTSPLERNYQRSLHKRESLNMTNKGCRMVADTRNAPVYEIRALEGMLACYGRLGRRNTTFGHLLHSPATRLRFTCMNMSVYHNTGPGENARSTRSVVPLLHCSHCREIQRAHFWSGL